MGNAPKTEEGKDSEWIPRIGSLWKYMVPRYMIPKKSPCRVIQIHFSSHSFFGDGTSIEELTKKGIETGKEYYETSKLVLPGEHVMVIDAFSYQERVYARVIWKERVGDILGVTVRYWDSIFELVR